MQSLHFSHLIQGICNEVKLLSFAIFISVSALISNQGSGLFSLQVLCVLHISNIHTISSSSIYATSANFTPLYSNLYSSCRVDVLLISGISNSSFIFYINYVPGDIQDDDHLKL